MFEASLRSPGSADTHDGWEEPKESTGSGCTMSAELAQAISGAWGFSKKRPAAAKATPKAKANAAVPKPAVVTAAAAKSAAKPASKPKATPAATPPKEEPELDENGIPISAARRAIIPAGQPLPPQPSANEISPEALAKVSEVEKTAKRISLMELTEKTCKWPVGDPATEDFWFCGLAVQQGKPYCEAHVGVAFQPMSSRRDRRR